MNVGNGKGYLDYKALSIGTGTYYGATQNVMAFKATKNTVEYVEQEKAFYRKFIEDLEILADENRVSAGQTEDYQKLFEEKMDEIFIKIQKGDTESSYQIGSQAFTEKEWNKFLENFDSIEEAADLLTAETTSCTYPTANPEDEDIRYITYYSEEGIHCRKAGKTEDEWLIAFETDEQYEKVMNFIGQFPSEWNMRFAAHENFWTDFLSDEIDLNGFMKFMEGTDNGIPDYSIMIGDSMFVDKGKVQWAKYLNPLGSRFYTAEEMHKQNSQQ